MRSRNTYDNMPESFQQGEKGEKAEEIVSALDDVVSALDTTDFDEITSALDTFDSVEL